MLQLIYELRKNCCGRDGTGKSKVLQEVLADLKNVSGKPSNFQRVAHVGVNSTAGFNLDNADPKILKFFEKVKLG